MTSMEIGCPHQFGIVHQCPTCGLPRHLSTSDHVTNRFLSEVESGEREWPERQATEEAPSPDTVIEHIRSVLDMGDVDRQAVELMRSGVPEDAAFYWAVPVAYALRTASVSLLQELRR